MAFVLELAAGMKSTGATWVFFFFFNTKHFDLERNA